MSPAIARGSKLESKLTEDRDRPVEMGIYLGFQHCRCGGADAKKGQTYSIQLGEVSGFRLYIAGNLNFASRTPLEAENENP